MSICRVRFAFALLSVFAGSDLALAQTPTHKLEFEVVSIKPSDPPGQNGITVGCRGGPGSADPTMIRCTNQDMLNLILHAYTIQHFQLAGVPVTGGQRFEITAKLPEGTTKEQVQEMY